jgi:hypothetical protein
VIAFTSENYDHIPRFIFQEEATSRAIGRSLPPLLALILLSAALGYVISRAYRRYPTTS